MRGFWKAGIMGLLVLASVSGTAVSASAEETVTEPGIITEAEAETAEAAEITREIHRGWYWNQGWYYYDSNGNMKTGWVQDRNKWYYLDGANEEHPGLMAADCKKEIGGQTYFFAADGAMKTGWILYPEGWYYAQSSGAMVTGWQKVGNFWYYLDAADEEYPGLMVADCNKTIGGYVFSFTSGGAMRTGWYAQDGYWYYLRSSGDMASGWVKDAGKWYYLDPENENKMTAGTWKEIKDKWYYFQSSGDMAVNWLWWAGEWYFHGTDGAMRTGWQKFGSCWYYFYMENDPAGGAFGTMARNATIGGYRVIGDGRHTEAIQYAYNTLNKVGWSLSAAYNWSAGLTYQKMISNASPGSEWFAAYGFKNHQGNCYVMAGTFYYMAKVLGYDVHQITGYVPLRNGGQNPHSWCEIVMNGTTYVFDPDFTNETGRNGYQISYGTSGTWRYQNYYRMN